MHTRHFPYQRPHAGWSSTARFFIGVDALLLLARQATAAVKTYHAPQVRCAARRRSYLIRRFTTIYRPPPFSSKLRLIFRAHNYDVKCHRAFRLAGLEAQALCAILSVIARAYRRIISAAKRAPLITRHGRRAGALASTPELTVTHFLTHRRASSYMLARVDTTEHIYMYTLKGCRCTPHLKIHSPRQA